MRILPFAFAVLVASSSCLAAAPEPEPAWAGIRHERSGWTLRVVGIQRQSSLTLKEVFGDAVTGFSGNVTPPSGTEYFVVTLRAESAHGTPEITFTKIGGVDAAGVRHESMLTTFGLNAAKKEVRIPTPVPVGSEMRWFELGDLRWPLVSDAPSRP